MGKIVVRTGQVLLLIWILGVVCRILSVRTPDMLVDGALIVGIVLVIIGRIIMWREKPTSPEAPTKSKENAEAEPNSKHSK
jgi:hypothetical protein